VAEDVCAHLELVALLGLGARGGRHDAGIVPDDVEARLLGEESLGRGLDGGQVVEDELEELEGAGGLGVVLLDLSNGLCAALLAASGNVNSCIVAVKNVDKLLADATVSASDDEDLQDCQDDWFETGSLLIITFPD
jgi:hypothetical protein